MNFRAMSAHFDFGQHALIVKFPKGFLVGANGVTNIGSFLPKDAKVAD
jgi:hypothetical protein